MNREEALKPILAEPVSLNRTPVVGGGGIATGAVVLFLSALAFTISYYQLLGESPDYQNYDRFLTVLREYGKDAAVINRFEPGFFLFSLGLVSLFATNAMVFSVTVTVAMLLKGYAVHLFANSTIIVLVVLAFYFARYFPLHELTQIRASLAIAVLLLATWMIGNEKRLLGVLFCCLAATFHMSALFVTPVLFMRCSSRGSSLLIAAAVFAGVSAGGVVLIGALEDHLKVIEMYQSAGFGDQPNLLSAALLLDWSMIIVGIVIWNDSTLPMKNVLLLQMVGMAIFYASVDFPVIAHRMRELVTVFWIIYISQGLRQNILVKTACSAFVAANIVLYFYLYVISDRLF